MPKSACRFLVPLALNDGTPIDAATFLAIKRRLEMEFGAYRIIDEEQEGSWQGQVESVMEIEVSVHRKRVPALRNVVIEIGRMLGQKAMYFRVPEPDVEIIDTETGEELEDEDNEGDDEVEQ